MSFTVQEVAQLLKQAKENEKPYVFFTGAGCSISAGVPSATGLIEEIHTLFPIQAVRLTVFNNSFLSRDPYFLSFHGLAFFLGGITV
ncbi:hypothetical protein [Acinetobacter sp. WCHAc010052]|uniref:hypothetical protein n=1 Tax=Acinetobacter sp. WCHAc010052 TaxID=2004647 RepID=UPI000B3CB786|nr:hypothetical protein [Acinetobacter sp. WCHAc010052]